MKVELFYFDGSPNHQPAAARLRRVIREEGLLADVEEIEIPPAVIPAESVGLR